MNKENCALKSVNEIIMYGDEFEKWVLRGIFGPKRGEGTG